MLDLSFDENTRQSMVNEREILFNKYLTIKKKNFNPFTIGLFLSPIFILIFAWVSYKLNLFGDNVELGALFAFSPIFICSIGRFWLNLRKINKIERLEKTIAELDNKGYTHMLNEDKLKLNKLLKIKFICNVLFWILVLFSLLSLMALIFTKGNNLFFEYFTIATIALMVIEEIINLFLKDKIMQYKELVNFDKELKE